MQPKWIRVNVALEPEADRERFLDSLEQVLGRREEPVQQVRGARVLSFRLRESELSLVRQLPGVRHAGPERQAELPPSPVRRKKI